MTRLAGFLGIWMEQDETPWFIKMKQMGLINRVIEAMGLESANAKWTPAEAIPLAKDADGEEATGMFNYASVVGMLLYLSGHTRPDVAYAVNCAARYMFCPKRLHEVSVTQIGRYLKATRTRGLIVNPSHTTLKIDAYPDADFAGMYGHEKADDPTCVRSRTGYIITLCNVAVLWQSKFQTEMALLTMQA